VDVLCGDGSRARKQLGWQPETSVEALARLMVDADLRRNERGETI
jgi:GDPmannose 4,6-dehydratase